VSGEGRLRRHCVRLDGGGWRCVDCNNWFEGWPPDTEPCPKYEVELERGSYAFEAQRDARICELVENVRREARAAVRVADIACFIAVIAAVFGAGAIVVAVITLIH
jgi:hypothetical protein